MKRYSEIGTIIDIGHISEVLFLEGEVLPIAVVLQARHVVRSQLHLGEFLWEVLGAVFVVQLRLVRSRLLLLVDGVPVDAGEPRMGHDLLGICWARSETGLWVLVEKLAADVSSVLAQEGVIESWLAVLDVSEELLFVFVVEWWLSAEHFVDDSSEGPPVRGLSMTLSMKDLWSKVLSSSANALSFIMSNNIFL